MVFALCTLTIWCPMMLLHIMRIFDITVSTGFCEIITKSSQLLTWTMPVLNPIIFSFVGRKFQVQLRRTLIEPCFQMFGRKAPTRWESHTSSVGSRRKKLPAHRTDTLETSTLFVATRQTSGLQNQKRELSIKSSVPTDYDGGYESRCESSTATVLSQQTTC